MLEVGDFQKNHIGTFMLKAMSQEMLKRKFQGEINKVYKLDPYEEFLNAEHIDKEMSTSFLRNPRNNGKTESVICSYQQNEGKLKNRYSRKQSNKCYMCNKSYYTIKHLLSSCETLLANRYTQRHNKVLNYIHMQLKNKYSKNKVKVNK